MKKKAIWIREEEHLRIKKMAVYAECTMEELVIAATKRLPKTEVEE
jgi:hypothetical protein